MEVIPLLLTQTNWTMLIQSCMDVLGISPSKELDSQGIKLETPTSLLASLPLGRKPQENLSDFSNPLLNHIFLGFLLISTKRKIENTLLNAALDYYIVGTNDGDDCIAIVSASLREWHHVITWGCRNHQPKSIRLFCNKCYEYLKSAGFGNVWNEEQRQIEDGTFILCKK